MKRINWDFVFLTLIIMPMVHQVKGQTNVALQSTGATCEASQANCEGAIDGISFSPSLAYRWGFFGEAVGTFLKLTFAQRYSIYTARFMQLYYGEEKNFMDLRLSFSDGSNREVSLTNRSDSYIWEEFILDPPVESTYVDIEVISAYSTGNNYNGFNEVEFYDGLLPKASTTTTSSTTSTITTTSPTRPTTISTTTTTSTITPTTASTTITTSAITLTNTSTTITTSTTTPTTTSRTTATSTTTSITTPTTTTAITPTTKTTSTTTSTLTPTSMFTSMPTSTPTTLATIIESMSTVTNTTIPTTKTTEIIIPANEEPENNNASTTQMSIGITVGVSAVVIIIIILASVFLYRWRKTQNELSGIKKDIKKLKQKESTDYYNIGNEGAGITAVAAEYEEINESVLSAQIHSDQSVHGKGCNVEHTMQQHGSSTEAGYEHLRPEQYAQGRQNIYTGINKTDVLFHIHY